MRQQYYLAALVGNLGDGGRYTFEPGRVADAAILHRHVEVDAQQHALALHVDVIEGAECFGHLRLLSRAPRSAKRCAAEPGSMSMLVPACIGPGSAEQREERWAASGARDLQQLPH